MHPAAKVADLLEEHGDTFGDCKGCKICKEIERLRPLIDPKPTESFKHILAKGEDMTRSDIVFLLENDVMKKDIQKALDMNNVRFFELLRNFGLVRDKKVKGNEEMAKRADITKEQYLSMDSKLTDNEKAKALGVGFSTLAAYKKNWGLTGKSKKSEYEAVKKEVKAAIAADSAIEEKLKQRIVELEKEVALYKPFKNKVEELEAAAEDLENEISTHVDKIVELEGELAETDELVKYWHENALKNASMKVVSSEMKDVIEEQQELIKTLKTTLKAVL